jgi:hypothetical protein
MSVTTTADEKISRAKELISDAYKELLIALNEDTWGHDDFNSEYIETIFKVSMKLLKLKSKL